MLQVSVCIELIFKDRPLPERIDAVAEEDLSAFEIWGWRDKDLTALARHKRRHDLTLVNMNIDPFVSLLEGNAIPQFINSLRESCKVARQFGCKCLTAHVQDVPWGSGKPWYEDINDPAQIIQHRRMRNNIVSALKAARPIVEGEGITLMLEPLNTLVDHAGYFLSSSTEAFGIVEEVDSQSIGLLFDCYHQQITEGNLISNITRHINLIKHLHIADVPGRHEPGTGEINYLNLLKAVQQAGYSGYVGLEYIPTCDSKDSLNNIKRIIGEVNRI